MPLQAQGNYSMTTQEKKDKLKKIIKRLAFYRVTLYNIYVS